MLYVDHIKIEAVKQYNKAIAWCIFSKTNLIQLKQSQTVKLNSEKIKISNLANKS